MTRLDRLILLAVLALAVKFVAAQSVFPPASGAASPPSGSLPKGAVMILMNGTCPAGYIELTAAAGQHLIATTTAAGDAGTVGPKTAIANANANASNMVPSIKVVLCKW